MHFTKLFRILFFHVAEVLLSLFSDYVSELKKLKRGYLICGVLSELAAVTRTEGCL